jgi:hypothetical protein
LVGVISYFVLSLGVIFFGGNIDLDSFLIYLIFILILGEFHYHWVRKNALLREEKNYLKQRFRTLSNAFFSLKVSHDQLEKAYLLKPVTIRSILIDLSKKSTEEKNLQTLFEIFQDSFSLKSAAYFKLDEHLDIVEEFRFNDSKFVFDLTHTMLDQAIVNKKSVFLAQSNMQHMENEPVLAVSPILDENENIIGVVVLEEMDFLFFNMDNILKIKIILEYFEDEAVEHKNMFNSKTFTVFHTINTKSFNEINRLKKLKRLHNINSSIIIVKTSKPAVKLQMDNFKMKKMRFMDMADTIDINMDRFYLFILPLEDIAGGVGMKDRIINELKNFDENMYEIIMSPIEKLDQVETWISGSVG